MFSSFRPNEFCSNRKLCTGFLVELFDPIGASKKLFVEIHFSLFPNNEGNPNRKNTSNIYATIVCQNRFDLIFFFFSL